MAISGHSYVAINPVQYKESCMRVLPFEMDL